MKNLLFCFLLISFITGCAIQEESNDQFLNSIRQLYPALQGNAYTKEQVKRVIDGDTFELASGSKVRLIGVDTPESTKTIEYYGKEASEYSKKSLEGKTVYLFRDAGDQDRYGRLLRYVFIDGNSTMFNETLVAEGYANPMTVPPNVQYADLFVKREREAREQKKGLWKDPSTSESGVPSSGQMEAVSSCDEPKIKGNINSKNEKIYHVPGGRYYDQTKAEVMFCTEREAEEAGFRKSKQ